MVITYNVMPLLALSGVTGSRSEGGQHCYHLNVLDPCNMHIRCDQCMFYSSNVTDKVIVCGQTVLINDKQTDRSTPKQPQPHSVWGHKIPVKVSN